MRENVVSSFHEVAPKCARQKPRSTQFSSVFKDGLNPRKCGYCHASIHILQCNRVFPLFGIVCMVHWTQIWAPVFKDMIKDDKDMIEDEGILDGFATRWVHQPIRYQRSVHFLRIFVFTPATLIKCPLKLRGPPWSERFESLLIMHMTAILFIH